VQVGQFKVYFDRTQVNSTAAMQFANRALVMDAFTASAVNRRDIGITIMNDEEVYPFNYYFGVFNGEGPLVNRFAQFTSEESTVGCPGGHPTVPVSAPDRGTTDVDGPDRVQRGRIDERVTVDREDVGVVSGGQPPLAVAETQR